LLALNLAWIQRPEWFGLPGGPGLPEPAATLPVRLAFLSIAAWWVLFSIPLFRRVAEPPARLEPGERRGVNPARVGFSRLRHTFRALRGFRQASLFLLAFLLYNDGIQTIIKMAAAYGTEIGIGQERAVFLGLAVYTGVSVVGYYMRTAAHFFALAFLVGLVQGGTQALSRS